MKEKLTQYIDLLFAGTQGCQDIRQEILQNTLDRYEDLIRNGKTPEEAYRLSIQSIGDITPLLSGRPHSSDDQGAFTPASPAPCSPANAAADPVPVPRKGFQIRNLIIGILAVLAAVLAISLFLSRTSEDNTAGISAPVQSTSPAAQNNGKGSGKGSSQGNGMQAGAGQGNGSQGVPGQGSGKQSSDQATAAENELSPKGTFSPSQISELKIQWVAGTISIRTDEASDSIQVLSSGQEDDLCQTVIRQDDDTLEISFDSQRGHLPGMSFMSDYTRDLTVIVPTSWYCQEMELDAASANVMINGLTAGEMEFSGASGICDFTDCRIKELSIQTASGDVRYTGELENLEFEAASASFTANLTNTPRSIEMDSASGDLTLTLPRDTGFTVKIQGMRSAFHSDFTTEKKNGLYIFGNGQCRIDMEAMSGDVTILQGN